MTLSPVFTGCWEFECNGSADDPGIYPYCSPNFHTVPANPKTYVTLHECWAPTPCPGPAWLKKIGSAMVLGLYPERHDLRQYALIAAVRVPMLFSVAGYKPFLAHAGPEKKQGCCWLHRRNRFKGLSRFISQNQVWPQRLGTIVFETAQKAFATYYSVYHCDNTVVYKLDTSNDAFVAIGHAVGTGYFFVGKNEVYPTLFKAEKSLRKAANCGIFYVVTYPYTGEPCNNKSGVLACKDNRGANTRQSMPWACFFDQTDQKWVRSRSGLQKFELSENVQNGVVNITADLKTSFITEDSAVTAVIREQERFDFHKETLFVSKPAKVNMGKCRILHTSDQRVKVCLSLAYSRAVKLHITKTCPCLSCTLLITNPTKAGTNPRPCAIWFRIGRYWHTDIKNGTHFRAIPLSTAFVLVPTVLVPQIAAQKTELARIVAEDTWLASGKHPLPGDTLLSVLRAENIKKATDKRFIKAILSPGETCILLKCLKALEIQKMLFHRKMPTLVKKYASALVMPQIPEHTLREIESGARLPYGLLCITFPRDLEL